MSLNPLYVIASGLDEYFVDKDTGLPLAEGTLNFFSDTNRSTPKDVFTITGTPPNYSYVNLGSVITLNATGTPVDGSGNSIVIYYYPYDNEGNLELYYVECFSSALVPQFTREGWPNTSVTESFEQQTENVPNFIPNGQFLLHNNIAADTLNNIPAGRITQELTQLAPGGWEFEVTHVSGGVYDINFPEYGEYITNPTSSPKYSCQIQCLGPDALSDRIDLRVKFGDVNKFASDVQQYTFSFTANTYLSADFTVGLFITKYFGTGGSPSPSENISVTTFTITSTPTLFQYSFTFGNNTGTQIGTNNDDAVYLILGFPHNIGFGAQLTDFVLVEGPVTITTFPATTDGDFIARSMIPPVPDPNGFDLYLPIVATPTGYGYDSSNIGKIYTVSYPNPAIGELLCNGSSYLTAGYSSDGIPYKRLYNVLSPANTPEPVTAELPVFGTGSNFVSASRFSGSDSFILSTNQFGSQTATSDGAAPTGFNFYPIIIGNNWGFSSYVYGEGANIWVQNTTIGYAVDVNDPGTSPFTINIYPNSAQGEIPGTDVAEQVVGILLPSLPSASEYFVISNTTTTYYVWYSVDGVGTDPNPNPDWSPIHINISSFFTAFDLAYVTACALSGFQLSYITVTGGSSVIPNSYFNFYANGVHYYVWMNLNGTGTDPSVPFALGIPVYYQSSYTVVQVQESIKSAINATYFAVPDLRGMIIKGYDRESIEDMNIFYRYGLNRYNHLDAELQHYIGSRQYGTLLSHQHNTLKYTRPGPNVEIGLVDANWTIPIDPNLSANQRQYLIEAVGTAQNDVNNIYLNYVIKY